MSAITTAYIGLGSNLDDPVNQVHSALSELSRLPDTQSVAQSRLYRSAPVGPADQSDYVNAVACVETALSAIALLDALQAIELRHHRKRVQHWGPRTLDLDILLFGDQFIQSDRLMVPHPELANRRFVLQPLCDIAPELTVPGAGKLCDVLAVCPDAPLLGVVPPQ